MKKTIIVQLSIKETKKTEFLNLAEIMVNKSISENGCLTYKLLKETGKENNFFVYEEYEDEIAIKKHNLSEHFKSFQNSVLPLLTKEPIIEIF